MVDMKNHPDLQRPAPEKFWCGTPPKACDICQTPITEEFVDGATRFGPWAKMCPPCHRRNGRVPGTGAGQRYEKVPGGRFKKVAG
jgi:hypothetical protein